MREDAKGVEVTGRASRLAGDPFRREIRGRAHQLTVAGNRRRPRRMRDPEVRNLDLASAGQQEIGRLDVAMDEPGLMSGVQARSGLSDDVHDPLRVKRTVGQHVRQRGSVDQLHDKERPELCVALVIVVHLGDRRMTQGSSVLGLEAEPGLRLCVLGVLGSEQLDRNGPGQHLVLSTPHLADATGGDLIDQTVPAS